MCSSDLDERFQGKGLAGELTRFVLHDARAHGRQVLPYCPFTRAWIRKHPEYVDLVPTNYRARFELSGTNP